MHGMRMATREKWAIFGAQCDRNADCRGGVFAVFAKIPPPTPHTAPHRTHPPLPIHHARKSARPIHPARRSPLARPVFIPTFAQNSPRRMKAGSIPAGGFPAATPEEELKTLVGRAFFRRWEWGRILGKIDFCVGMPARHAGDEFVSLLWAEAKKGHADLREALVQLVLTIGRARTFDRHLPPAMLAAFDCEQIAFVPYTAVQAVFQQSDFNWRVAPSDHSTREFRQLEGLIGESLERESAIFSFSKDERALRGFIWNSLGHYAGGVGKIDIDKNNFISIYNRWLEAVKPTIGVDWDRLQSHGIIDGDFFLADVLSEENKTLKDKLFVLLEHDRYTLNRKVDESGLFTSAEAHFTDNQRAHTQFWNRYVRPPAEVYWDFLVARRDLLVPQDIRERKGSFFTPRQWVELSQKYLADTLGEDWQEEYTVWDPAAGTGNLLNGLTNKYNIWASTLDQQDVDVMRDRIRNGANLLESHVFQFDFLNDSFDKLPAELRAIVDDPERRKKLVVYMNPPYAETGRKEFGNPDRTNKRGVSFTKIREQYAKRIGIATKELAAQFVIRTYCEIPGCILAEFSKLKNLQGSNFLQFRELFRAKLEKIFLVPADTFDNVAGQFPIGFKIWNGSISERFEGVEADLYNRDGEFIQKKKIYPNQDGKGVNQWVIHFRELLLNTDSIGYIASGRNDFQNVNKVYIVNQKAILPNARGFWIESINVLIISIYFSVQHIIQPTWYNDRDQFYWPHDSWRDDTAFQHDCLAFTLLHGQNRITCAEGVNPWIPYTEHEVDAKEKFSSHFMTDFLAGKLGREKGETGDLFAGNLDLIPKEPVVFSPEARAVLDAGRALWRYYHAQPNANPNAALYDIRLHFQGCKPNGHMNPKSDDARYTELISTLRKRLKVLARKIEPKVYEHGFLLG